MFSQRPPDVSHTESFSSGRTLKYTTLPLLYSSIILVLFSPMHCSVITWGQGAPLFSTVQREPLQ